MNYFIPVALHRRQHEKVPVSKFKVGDKVVLKVAQEAYYSGYAGNPIVIVPAGTIGVVGSVKVPFVWRRKGKGNPETFNCVDFKIPGVYSGNPVYKNDIWRCAVIDKDMRRVK